MSLEEAAGKVAEHLERQEFVEMYAHHDADGITAASILCIAMLRRDKKFRLRVVAELPGRRDDRRAGHTPLRPRVRPGRPARGSDGRGPPYPGVFRELSCEPPAVSGSMGTMNFQCIRVLRTWLPTNSATTATSRASHNGICR